VRADELPTPTADERAAPDDAPAVSTQQTMELDVS